MASRYPIRAALAGAAAPAVAVLAFGNQWFTEEVRIEAKTALKRRLVNTVGGPFPWRFTPHDGNDGGTIWASQLVGILVVVGLTFLVAWLVARSTAQAGLLIGVWGGTVLATMAAYALYILLTYGAFYGGHDIEPGINRFWYAVFHSTDASLWAAGVGLVAGGAALLFGGGPARMRPSPDAPTSQMPGAWGTPPPGSPPTAPWGAGPPADGPSTVSMDRPPQQPRQLAPPESPLSASA